MIFMGFKHNTLLSWDSDGVTSALYNQSDKHTGLGLHQHQRMIIIGQSQNTVYISDIHSWSKF